MLWGFWGCLSAPSASGASSMNCRQHRPLDGVPVGMESDHACLALCLMLGTEVVLPTFLFISSFLLGELG